MSGQVVQTLLGTHKRAEIHKHVGPRADVEYTIFDPDVSRPVCSMYSRFDEAYAAALRYINSQEEQSTA